MRGREGKRRERGRARGGRERGWERGRERGREQEREREREGERERGRDVRGKVKWERDEKHWSHMYSAFTLATLELGQTSLISFSKFNSSRVASTWEVPVVVLLSTQPYQPLKIKLHQSGPVATCSVNTLVQYHVILLC